jgi:hypothetical protein
VGAIDAAADAYLFDRRPEDLALLQALAREYLSRNAAPSADRIRLRLDEAMAADAR